MATSSAPAAKLPPARLVGRWWPMLLLLAVLGALIVEALTASLSEVFGTDSVLAGDVSLYEMRWKLITDGFIPYVDMVFEHLPLAIAPIGTAGVLSDLTGIDYSLAFIFVTAGLLFWTTAVVARIGRDLGAEESLGRFLTLVVPLLPLVLFRNDILPVLCSAIAISAWVRGREITGILGTAAGVLAKGWPIVLGVTEWWRGNRVRAVLLAIFTAAVVATLLALPGFQSGRSFSGVHQETLSGSIVLLWRHLAGSELGIAGHAGAVYLDVGRWAVLLNLAVGGALGLWALSGLRMGFTWGRGHTMLAALVLALILASPLLSAQFLIWPTAFLAVVARRRALVVSVAASLLTIVMFGFWDREALWWSITLLGRNALVVVLAVLAVRAAASGREQIA